MKKQLMTTTPSDAPQYNTNASMASPLPLEMLRTFASAERSYLKQKPKGVLLEMCCCQQENEFGIGRSFGGWTLDGTDEFYLIEDASFACRFCCAANRQTRYLLSQGGKVGGVPFVEYKRPLRCPIGCCKCCCFQELLAQEVGGSMLGVVRERQWCCVANFTVYDAQGTPVYDIHQPTCCGGTCVNCCDKDGAGCCRVPFFIYPSGGDEQSRSGKITKVWLGMKKECCTLANTFEVDVPKGATAQQVALVYGAGLLLDHAFYEGGNNNNNNN